MAAMRHSRIELTMNLYTDPVLLDVARGGGSATEVWWEVGSCGGGWGVTARVS